ncbi:MAG: hypothetical protein ABL907_08470 [Hyphomicrobium sp.]
MTIQYVLLDDRETPLPIGGEGYLKALVVIEKEMTEAQKRDLARQLIGAGAFYVCTWGIDCERMHDAVDNAGMEREQLEPRSLEEYPVVMTTWHSKESLDEALWFFKALAFHPDLALDRSLIVHVADQDGSDEFLAAFEATSLEKL